MHGEVRTILAYRVGVVQEIDHEPLGADLTGERDSSKLERAARQREGAGAPRIVDERPDVKTTTT